MFKNISDTKSFTLVELLITIGIIAILTSAVFLTLNPSELLAQGRDTRRIADIKNLQTVIDKYKYSEQRLGSLGSVNTVYVSLVDSGSSACADLGLPSLALGWQYQCVTSQNTLMDTDGTGWIPINLAATGVMSILPVDPSDATSTNTYYSYLVDSNGKFELVTKLESQKKITDTAAKDGGYDSTKFEIGEDLLLWKQAAGL